jgi:hypothetical protein
MPVGYHDDSFALETLPGSAGFHFLDLLSQAGATGKWRQQPIGGELRPELQACIFDQPPDCPNIEAGGDNTVDGAKDFSDSVAQTHASWLINQTAFDPGYAGADQSRALAGSQSLGYQFSVTRAAIDQPNSTTLQVGATIATCGSQSPHPQVARTAVRMPERCAGVGLAGGQATFQLRSPIRATTSMVPPSAVT